MNIKQTYSYLYKNLTQLYDKKEAANIAELSIEKITGLPKIDRIVFGEKVLNANQMLLIKKFTEQLLKNEPVQYVLNEAWFAGMQFYVDKQVLIPRPETEELVNWVINDCLLKTDISILDIGTGSGCIAIALKNKLPSANITALDVSDAALKIASKNAVSNHTNIYFIKTDIMKEDEIQHLSSFNIIVSNPPYITKNEAELMNKNVLLYEPHLALFVDDANPFLFYESISNFALYHLKQNGFLYFEINESFANEVVQILHQKEFKSIGVKKDLHGKDRIIKAVLSR